MNALPIAIAGTQQLEPRWSMKCMSDSLSVQYKLRVRAFWRLWANKGRHVDNAITISERRGLCTLSKKVPTLTPNSDSGWKQPNFKWNIFVGASVWIEHTSPHVALSSLGAWGLTPYQRGAGPDMQDKPKVFSYFRHCVQSPCWDSWSTSASCSVSNAEDKRQTRLLTLSTFPLLYKHLCKDSSYSVIVAVGATLKLDISRK